MNGLGVNLFYLAGGSPNDKQEFVGRTIQNAAFTEKKLTLTFTDGSEVELYDGGQSCCENRYMKCDDDLSKIIGGTLVKFDAKDAPEEVGQYGDTHEVCFVEVATDKGFITIATHNEHNGYYGGFGLALRETISATGLVQ